MRQAIIYDNRAVKEGLSVYDSLSGAVRACPEIDDILTGVSLLDYGGNTRPLQKEKLYYLLSGLDVVSTAEVLRALGCSLSHAKRLCIALRVASKAVAPYLLPASKALSPVLIKG